MGMNLVAGTETWRVVETSTGRTRRWRDLAIAAIDSDVVFVGEQHDDPETHRVELRLFDEVARRWRRRAVLAMEMFERDQQAELDRYLAGKSTAAELAARVKLWGNYETDYRPMVDLAKARGIPVVGSNAPQRHVRRVGREGLGALGQLPPAERGEVASVVQAPAGDAYWDRFKATMSGMEGSHGMEGEAMLRRVYEAQCLRDDTMAESIDRALAGGRRVFHVNGSFHSDGGLGTAARLRWRRPLGVRVLIVKVVPVQGDPAAADAKANAKEADWLVHVPDLRKPKGA